VLAATEFATLDPLGPATTGKRAKARLVRAVTDQLDSTPAEARQSYMDSRVCPAFRGGCATDAAVTVWTARTWTASRPARHRNELSCACSAHTPLPRHGQERTVGHG
jgi:hypothetical protein